MNTSIRLLTPLAIAAMLTAPLAQAASMTRVERNEAKDRIAADYKADKASCNSLAGNAKDICIQEAKGKEKVAYANLQFNYTGSASDQTKLQVAKAKAAYAIAKEKCDDQTGNNKDVCVKKAKSVEIAALADAKMDKKIVQAVDTAAQDKLNAEYKVEIEKCDSQSGDAKSACVAAAKTRFGKT